MDSMKLMSFMDLKDCALKSKPNICGSVLAVPLLSTKDPALLAVSLLSTKNPVLQSKTARALAKLMSSSNQSIQEILNVPAVLESLVELANQDKSLDLAETAARAICNLADTKNLILQGKNALSKLLETLAGSLSKHENLALQRIAAMALANLSWKDQSIKEKILNVPGLLYRLVELVDQDIDFDLADIAARAICNLATIEDLTLQGKIAQVSNLLEVLTRSLSKHENPALQRIAAMALANLSWKDQSIKEKILNVPGLLYRLVELVDQDIDFDFADIAARAICNLATTEDLTLQGKIAQVSNLLEVLVRSLSKHENPALQRTAAMALANLSWKDQSIKEKILNVPRLLYRLVELVDQDIDFDLAYTTTRAICNLATIEDLTLQGKIAQVSNLLEVLTRSLSKHENPALQRIAAMALANLSWKDQLIKEKILNVSGLLYRLVELVDQDIDFDLANIAARAICNLATTEDLTLQGKIAQVSNLLEVLVRSLSKHENPALQRSAATALANLSWKDQSIKEKILNVSGLLYRLVELVDQDIDFDLADIAARAICNLATTEDLTLQGKIAQVSNLLEVLARSLSKHENPALQKNAATALANLSWKDQSIKEKILNVSGLLYRLVELVDQDIDFDLADIAARAICNLATTEDLTLQGKIAQVSNLLEVLARSLSKHENPALQKNAATALANLSWKDQSIKEKILNVSGLLYRLVELVDQDINFDLAKIAARAICNLAAIEDLTLQGKIVQVPKLLEILAVSLSRWKNPALQTIATGALSNLSLKGQSLKEIILNIPGLLDRLVELVDQDKNFDLAEIATRVISNLAATEDLTLRRKIVQVSSLLDVLAMSLSKSNNLALQANAAGALANLSFGDQSIQEKIFNISGLLDNLTKLLDQDENFSGAEQAARVVCNLAASNNLILRSKIMCVSDLVRSLAMSLSKIENPALQIAAAWFGAYLEQSIREKLIDVPQVLDDLVKSINQYQSSDLAKQATLIFCKLTGTDDLTAQDKAANFLKLVESLGESFLKGQNFAVQRNAAMALANLGLGNQSVKDKVLKLPMLSEKLVLVVEACFRDSIMYPHCSTGGKAGEFLGLDGFYRLMEFFCKEGSRDHQLVAARLVARVASTEDDAIRSRLFHFCGDKLTCFFVQQKDRELQMEAARVFANLSFMKDEVLRKGIIQIPTMLDALAKSLMHDRKPVLESQAWGKSGSPASNENDRNVTDKFQDEVCSLQLEAARVLTNWVISKNDSFKGEMFLSPCMLVWAGMEYTTQVSERGSECKLRSDMQSLGLETWETQFNPEQMCALYGVRTDQQGVDFMFFRAEAMANLFGIGLQHGIVSIVQNPELKILIKEIEYEQWKDVWLDSYTGSFKPMIFQRLEESSNDSGDRDVFERSGSVDFSILSSFKHGQTDCSISCGSLYKRWITDLVKCLQHSEGIGNDERCGVKNEEGNSEGDQQGSRGYDQRDGTGHDQKVDTNSHQSGTVDGQGDNTRNGGQGSGIGTSQGVGGGVVDGGGKGGAHGGDGQRGGDGGAHDGGGSENGGNRDPSKPSEDQSGMKVVVHVQLLDESAVCKAYDEDLKCEANGGGSDEVHGEGFDLIRTMSTIDPTLMIEFLWASKVHKKVNAELAVGYYISNTTPTKKCKWYQNDLQVSFCCTEGRQKIMLDGPPRIISPTVPVPIQTTEKNGQSTSDTRSKRMSGAAGVGVSGNKLQLQFDMGNSSGGTAERGMEAQKSCNYKCLADQSDFVVTSRRKQNNLSFTASYLYHIEPALHWDEKKWCETRPTGLYADVDLSVGGAWVLVDDDDEQLKFKFEATKMLFKSTNPEEASDEKQLKPKSKWWRKRSTSPDQGQAPSRGEVELNQTEPSQVWQGLTRELILDHNFERFFGKLEWCSPHYIKDPLPETIDVVREVLRKIERSYRR